MGEMIEIPSDAATLPAYLAVPEGGKGPGVVVIQEWWGLVDHIKEVCDRFAAEGFVALAPDLYHGKATREPDEAAKMMMAMRIGEAAEDMSAAVDALLERSSGHGVGVVGFCMGGGLALVLACHRPDAVPAVAPFYGLIPWAEATPDYSKMTAAVHGHYASEDASAPPDAVRALASELEGHGREVEMTIHSGTDHAFFNDTRPEVYNGAAAADAWQQTVDFFHRRLG